MVRQGTAKARGRPAARVPTDSPGGRLRGLRRQRGWNQQELADRLRCDRSMVSKYETGEHVMTPDIVERAAALFDVRPGFIQFGEGPPPAEPTGIAVIGKVGASAEGDFADDYALGAGGEYIEPLSAADHIALTVEGDSMVPRFRPGERVIFGPRYDDPSPLVGQEVMARLKDGRKLLKVLRRGSRDGLFTLYSINTAYDAIEDVELKWALPFRGLRA